MLEPIQSLGVSFLRRRHVASSLAGARQLARARPLTGGLRRGYVARVTPGPPRAAARQNRATFADKPALLLWGLRDIAFRRQELEQWQSALTDTAVHEFEDCGHFLAEEAPERILPALRDFMRRA